MKSAPQKIGEPLEQWPKLSAALGRHTADDRVVDGMEAELVQESKSLPRLLEFARDVASAMSGGKDSMVAAGLKQRTSVDFTVNRHVALSILGLPRVKGWILQADSIELADWRACSLVTGVALALHNAHQLFLTPKHHREHYISLAERIERKLGSKRLAKLQRDLRNDRAPSMQRYQDGDDMEQLAHVARALSGANDSSIWTVTKPYHEHAARNEFIQAVTELQKLYAGSSSHELTADIVAVFFSKPGQETSAVAIKSLTRRKSPKKRHPND